MHARALALLVLVMSCLVAAVAMLATRRGEAGDDPAPVRDDGRAGTVRALQGAVFVRPATARRFTPLARGALLAPGDMVRVETVGAHLAELDLVRAVVTLGPGTTVRLVGREGLVLDQGTIEVAPRAGASFEVKGPGGFERSIAAPTASSDGASSPLAPRRWARSDTRRVEVIEKEPSWLASYRAAAGSAWAGGLVATIGGREVDLAVVRHDVVVEVRDQIARTTIEQVFRNATDVRTEGVFRFPLPADASISGFAMWIGGELVEADVVERQRARAIYEDILRRKKDPGLLEWEGGNLFQARVFPIEPHSTKRVRIRYTQVLPLEGRAVRYRLPLTSELLRRRPLEHLSVTVRASSETPIAGASSPTHEMAIHTTRNTAELTYALEGASPDRDLEVALELTSPPSLEILPHRRGEDGYFLARIRPPSPEGQGFARDLVPEGDPLDVLLVADTSASMHRAARDAQDRFLRAFVALLGEEDRVRVLAYDVEPVWLLDRAAGPGDASLAEALDRLAARRSLGWSDVERGLVTALEAARERTLVLHVGDGIGTNGDADPQALATRVAALGARFPGRTVHAVAPSSTYEAPILDALAGLGGGTRRQVDAGSPEGTAATLLRDALLPQWKDLTLRVDGLATARVYPETLPNAPAGTQWMVLGRFAPTDRDVKVSVYLEGRGPDGPVRLSTDAVVPAADGGNEFLPRLWARRHLDALLAQGASPENQAEIVEFSERFGILTPYTSLLVLESDEDREKYGVGRRVAMRDGERFFAEARDRAAAEARRAALRDAGAWRAWLRDSAMREIAGLGREFSVPTPILQTPASPAAIGETIDPGMREAELGVYRLDSVQVADEVDEFLGTMAFEGGEAGGFGGTRHLSRGGGSAKADARKSLLLDNDAPMVGAPAGAPPMGGAEEAEFFDAWDARAGESANDGIDDEELAKESGFVSFRRRAERARHVAPPTIWTSLRHSPWWDGLGWPTGSAPFDPVAIGFPALPPDAPRARPEPPKTPWSAALRERLAHLLRRDRLLAATRAWHVVALSRNLHPITGRVVGASRRTSWIAADGWRVDLEDATRGSDATAWTLGGRRVVIDPAARLGRRRPSGEDDATAWSLPIADLAAPDLLPALEASYDVRIVEESAGRSVWRFVPREASPRVCTEWVFDESRRALVEERKIDLRRRRVLRRTVHRDFLTVGDLHLPARSSTFDARDRAVFEWSFAFRALDVAAWDAVRASLEVPDAEVLVLDGSLPKAADARAALERGDATLADRLTILADASARRDAEEVARSLESLRSADPTHAFAIDYLAQFAWMRTRSASAWDELLPRRIADVRAGSGRRGVERAWRLFGATTSSLGPTSRVELLTSLRSMLASDAAPSGADDLLVPEELAWRRRRYDATLLQALDAAQRSEEAFRLALDAAARKPDNLGFQLALAHRMRDRRDRAGSRDVYERAGSRASTWDEGERDALFSTWTDALWQDRRTDDLARVVRAWTELNPESVEAWQRATSIDLLFGSDSSADAASLATIADGPSSSDDDVLRARRAAAITLLLGRGWQFHLSGPQPDHAEALAAFALRALDPTRDTDDESRGAGSRILGNHAFGGLEVGRRARLAAFGLLADNAATAPRERLEPLVALEQRYHDPRAEEVRRVLDILVARHRAESDPIERDALATWILDRFDRLDDRPGALGFLRDEAARRRVSNEPIETVARHLVQRLMSGPDGDEAVETEIVEWVATLAGLQTDERSAAADAASWARRLAETFENWRTRLALGPPEALDALSREARAAAERTARQAARASLPARLDALHAMLPPSFAPWLRLEALAASVQSGAEIEARTAWAVERLGSSWARERRPSERVERERLSTAVAFATLRREPPQGLAERWIQTIEGLDAADRAAHATEVPPHWALDARYHVARFLAAHDRVAELRARLETWLGTEGTTSRWAVLLAHLEAEGGDLAAASARLEPLRARNELDAASLQRLATWRFALGDDVGRQAAFASALEQSDPWTLRQRLAAFAREVQRRGERAAAELDPDALPIAEQLLARDTSPEEYVPDLLALYLPTKDPRIPALFVPGLVGHSVERAYGALLALSGIVDDGVHEEATLDALEAAIDARRRAAGTDRDRRVLDLATSRVASRAGEVLAADPAFARAATTALERALAAPLGAGERLPLARHLAALAVSRDPNLDRIVTTGLAWLVRDAAPGEERWRCAVLAAERLERGGRLDERDDLLERTWKEVRSASPERLGRAEAELLEALVAAHRERRHVERAESFLLAELAERPHDPYTQTWSERLFELRRFALQSGLRTRLGEGAALHAALRAEVLAQLDEIPERVSSNVANLLSVTTAAVEGTSRLKDAARDLAAWAHGPLHDLLARHPLEATHLATMVAQALVGLVGPADGVRLLLDRVDAEPALVRRIGADVARQSLDPMASWRRQGGGAMRSLEPRLFSLVSAALESHLLAGTRPGRPFWTVHDKGVHWNERLDELQAVIEAVVERESGAAHVAMRGANVLYGPMQRRGAAIDVLEAAVARIPDEVSMRRHLVDWLIDAGRAQRARPHAEKLVTDHPDEWSDRRRLARVLIQLRRSDDLAAHLDATEARWKERKAFRSSLARSLADFAREGDLAPRALAWIKEALSLRIAERGDRGGQDPWLSDTYGILAEIHRARRESAEAFAAARAALVHTSARDATRRNTAESRLADVLRDAPDLEPLDAAYEAEVAQEGLDAAPLRIAFAIAWQDRDRIDRAERHLLEAREIEPGVARVHTLLVSLYDRAERPADAIGALFGSIENAPTALDAIEDLARRYATAGDEVERRRALTTLAEQAPHQADGHRRLGRAWSADGRHAEALEQWAQVVRTDPLDPNSWLEYADEAVRAGELDTARRALDRVSSGSWGDRFGDVKAAAAARRARLPRPPGPR